MVQLGKSNEWKALSSNPSIVTPKKEKERNRRKKIFSVDNVDE
jgi:hypothetical protein